ncbi:HAMP domain-containing protein [Flavihumibacter sp. R14]|nr:HAMP domain-containing protein [Flavihumibacter soli]
MFDWFILQPASVAALSEFMLSLVLTLYIFRIRNRSFDTQLFLCFVSASTFYYLVAFLFHSSEDFTQQGEVRYWLHGIILAIFQLSILPFVYYFRFNPFQRESIIVFLSALIIVAISMYYHYLEVPFTYLIYQLITAWATIVFIRKAIVAQARTAGSATSLSLPPASLKFSINAFFGVLREPANRDSKAFLAFAWWQVLVFIIWINVNLMVLGFIPRQVWNVLHNTLILVSIVWLVTIYINYAWEPTTFVVKLVGLSLCSILLLLGVMGFLLHPGASENAGYILSTLSILIIVSTLVIVLIFPLFFKKNLLQPLDQVLNGVQQVNAGNLDVKVPVEVNDEIGQLAAHFNVMTTSLRRYSEEMENLVSERTAELLQSIENLKKTQAQLIQAEKMASLGELTAGIAHEIQNPLNFVNNFSEVSTEMLEELEKEQISGNEQEVSSLVAEIKQNLEKVIYHGKRADAIVKGMLLHSRSSAGKKEPTDINALADEYLRLSYHGFRAKDKSFNVVLQTCFDPVIKTINIIPQDIARVMLNLFTNAFFAVAERARNASDSYEPAVIVTTIRRDDTIEIHIRDNGDGIPQKILDKIFQPFFTTKPTGEGTGLGLSLSYDIIKAHGGEITVETREGDFAEFIMKLPV